MDVRNDTAPAEDVADRAALAEFRRRFAVGEEELVPSGILDRLLSSEESRVRVCREHRGMTAATLVQRAGIAQAYLSCIEAGERMGTAETLRKLTDALGIPREGLSG